MIPRYANLSITTAGIVRLAIKRLSYVVGGQIEGNSSLIR